jgi:hypothetical protein
MNKRIERIRKLLTDKHGFSKDTADALMMKHDDLVDVKLTNNESEDDIALALESAWLDEKFEEDTL